MMSEIRLPNHEQTSQQPKVKPFVELIEGGGELPKLINNLNVSIKKSPARKIKCGSVAKLKAKFELIGTLECIDSDKEGKVEVKRLNSSKNKHSTPAKRGRKPRVKSAEKDSLDLDTSQ